VQNHCLLKHSMTKISIESDKNEIHFYEYRSKTDSFKIRYPPTIHPNNHKQIIITDSGFSSPQSIRWLNDFNQVVYKQKIQLGWGGFVIEEK